MHSQKTLHTVQRTPMKARLLRFLPALMSLVCIMPANGSLILTDRLVEYFVHFNGNTFQGAYADIRSTTTVDPASTGTLTSAGGYPPANQGITYFATGNVSITPASAPAGTTSVTTTVTANGGGTYGFEERMPAGTGFANPASSTVGVYPYAGFLNLEVFSPT